MKIVLLARDEAHLDEEQISELHGILGKHPEYELAITNDAKRIGELLPNVEVLAGKIPYEMLADMPRLAWFQLWGAGVDWLRQFPEVAAAGFTITNVTRVHAVQLAEHALALVLAVARRLPEASRAQVERTWYRPPSSAIRVLDGATMLVIGFGSVGRQVSKLARALGMSVTAVKRTPAPAPPDVHRVVTVEELIDQLPLADVIVVTIPLTPETEGLIGARELTRLKPTAILVNIGRGRVVDEDALVEALAGGRLGGAALDVFADEPLARASPLWGFDNVLLTAHYAGMSPHYERNSMKVFLANLRRYLAGRPLSNVVDKRRGY